MSACASTSIPVPCVVSMVIVPRCFLVDIWAGICDALGLAAAVTLLHQLSEASISADARAYVAMNALSGGEHHHGHTRERPVHPWDPQLLHINTHTSLSVDPTPPMQFTTTSLLSPTLVLISTVLNMYEYQYNDREQ